MKDENKEEKQSKEINTCKEEDNTTIGEETKVNQTLTNIENQKKTKALRHISFKLENNVIISFKNDELIIDFEITHEREEDIISFKSDFNLYLNILKRDISPHLIIKKFDKNEIKTKKDYELMENLDEQQMILELYDENEEDIKSLEKRMEKSINKSYKKY